MGFDPERLADVFHRALEQEPAHRLAFLDEICVNDPDLRAEVESMLGNHERATDLFDTVSHGAAAVAPEGISDESLVGRSLGQYRVLKRLGRGGMGVVYLADDTRLGRRVAIKALAQQSTQDDVRQKRLRREARAAAALSHPLIATVYALEEFDSNLYIVCEYVPGKTLREELADGPLPLDSLLNTCVDIARALTVAHANGVVHRDLKPENVMRAEDGGIKVLDFGLARFQGSQRLAVASATHLTEPGIILGTPGYMPPEQLRGSEVDFRADVFSFGVLAFELASGVHPFSGSSVASTIARVLETEPPDLSRLSRSCPAALSRITRKCLQKAPEQRYSTTRELLEELEQLRRDVAETAVSAPSKKPVRSDDKRRAPGSRPQWWWWQFHQASIGLVYYAMLYPLWRVLDWSPGLWGSLLFFSTLVAVGIAANLRFHLLFTSRFYPAELVAQRDLVFTWVRWSDWLFVLLLLVAAGLIAGARAGAATLLVAVAVGSFIAFMIIEPATTRAAFRRSRAKTP